MNEASLNADAAARQRALDVSLSCIVRAPAGSGKTELLIQRYLALLATVEEPEEIIAITFTRKAAGEMRSRIVAALESAAGVMPTQLHKRQTWELAKRAEARDQEQGWQLRAHPARMRIQTIDSLNAELTRQMPLLSGFGAQPRVNERPLELYEEAARRSLRLLDEGEPEQAAAVRGLAQHLDNDLGRIHRLLARMLARRDQWLRHLKSDRASLEAALAREVTGHLLQMSAALPQDCRQELLELVGIAGQVLRGEGSESAITACADLMALQGGDVASLNVWTGIAEFLLTKDGSWRARHDKRQGVLKDDAAMKARAGELLRRMEREEPCRALLAMAPHLPEPRYSDEQWRILEAMLKLLPLATAQLRLVFAERGEVDFAEISLGASQALGEQEAPTDLALALDYRIRHLLVDEFQDTSVNQFHLLEMLTAGWQPGDGRSLFLVGDPAQSIYRFREAEVGLFLRAWEHGVGGVPLEALQLHANFRSRPALVEWSNRSFAGIFPVTADVASGAVPYVDAVARREPTQSAAVKVHGFVDTGDGAWRDAEAARVLQIIEAARGMKQGTAILARAKNHLAAIVRRLRREAVHFRAVEVENLGGQPVVQDLLALTRALTHPADRTAWLAVLRAPWCGLSLAELHALAGDDVDAAIPALMQGADALAKAHPRFAHTRQVLSHALAGRARGSLREQVEHAWLALGGPAALAGAEALADAEAYLELLEELGEGGALLSVAELEQRLALLFARPDPEADDSLQLMTIHKAKGLEFDVVILPGLAAATRGEDQDLLVWLERPRAEQEADILLAPLDAPGQDHKDPLYAWVRTLRKEQSRLEKARLLYVAVTRAREELHLLGAVTVREKEGRRELSAPKPGSLLAPLWPTVKDEFEQSLAHDFDGSTASAKTETPVRQAAGFTRLRQDWKLPEPSAAVQWAGSTVLASEQVPEFEWVGETLRHVGTVVHRMLQRIAEEGVAGWDEARLRRALPVIRQFLVQTGVRQEELEGAARDVIQAVQNTMGDERGRWLLSSHVEARSEYALSLLEDGRLKTGVIDRSFTDEEGTRWIVDYKTSRHSGTDLDAFLEQERLRYAPQLERYAFLMRGLGARRVKIALYFPLLQRFLSWEPLNGPEP
jgi:ATP-dependent helicase/nuclease subunit A